MPSPILTTKLYVPRVRPEMISRARLVEHLAVGLRQSPTGFARKLTLISAPAGFGKTTLLSQCVQHYGQSVAWLSLDREDDEPTRFWTYVIAALQTVQPNVGTTALGLLQSGQGLSFETILTSLLNDLAQVSLPLIVVLDDLHLITDAQIHQGTIFFVENLPAHVHLAVSSRADPPWPLARVRARGELTELRSQELRFTPQEAAVFLNDAMDLDLGPEDIAALDDRIEGWVAGLQMAALSMRGRKQSQDPHSRSAFIKSFSGSHRFILDYLVEEVLAQQSSTVQSFLFKTSILERLSASLCDAMVGDPGLDRGEAVLSPGSSPSQAILEDLETQNLFLLPLDDERHWYRYHRLFSELLVSRLEQQESTEELAQLHSRASEWYERHELVGEAVSHALAAEDLDRVTRLVEANALRLIYNVELLTVSKWLDTVSAETLRSRPWLAVAHAWALVYAGQLPEVESRLQIAEEGLEDWQVTAEAGGQEKQNLARITGHMATIRSYSAAIQDDMSRSATLASKALDLLPADDARARSFAAGTLGMVRSSTGDLEAAARLYDDAIDFGRTAGDSYNVIVTLGQLAGLEAMRGRLHMSAQYCQEALQLVEEQTRKSGRQAPVEGYIHAYLSQVLYEWNDLAAAKNHAQEAIKLCRRWGQKTIQPFCYRALSRALQATGDTHSALEALQMAKRTAASMSSWQYEEAVASEVELHLDLGDTLAASRWAKELKGRPAPGANLRNQTSTRALVRVLVSEEETEQALVMLAALLDASEAAGATGLTIEALTLQALALQAAGEREQAISSLEKALVLAEPEGYVRTFVQGGAPMGLLLQQVAARSTVSGYAHRLLAVLDGPKARETAESPVKASPPLRLLDPLSQRELEVLRLLATSLSTQEIADELYVAVSTVRSHTKRLYSKLDAHSRLEAVERGHELGLL